MKDGDIGNDPLYNIIPSYRNWRHRGRKACRRMACRRCGREVQPQSDRRLRKEYPYYCPECGRNRYSFECVEIREADDASTVRQQTATEERARGKK